MSTPSVTAPGAMHGARLALGVRADERDRVGVGRVVLLVGGRDRRRTGSAAARGSPGAAARSRRGRAVIARLLPRPRSPRPATSRPVGRERVVVRVVDRVVRCVELDEVDDVEAGPPQQAEELAVGQLPLDADLAGPLQPAEPRCGRRSVSPGGPPRPARRGSRACCCGGTRAAARPQQPIRLGEPAVRVAPDARAVLGDGEVEALGRQRHVLGARLDERELEPELLLAAPRRRELGRSDVDADRARAAPGEPRGDVGRAAAELDDVEAVDRRPASRATPRGRRRRPR